METIGQHCSAVEHCSLYADNRDGRHISRLYQCSKVTKDNYGQSLQV